MHVVATAGHVDHGKSTLVRALTGTDPDRYAEEKRRGLTIDLGYAWTRLDDVANPPPDPELAFVDVPGHERFIATMLAGLGPAPAVMFVVAADEGWRAQSSDHLAAVAALGLRHGLLVITRSDLADPGPALAEAQSRLADSSLGVVPAVSVSGRTGQGLAELRGVLADVVRALPDPLLESAPVRLWVDRSFTVRGAGTVVTGTLGQGRLRTGDELIMRDRRVRVRGLQALGEPTPAVEPVARVAVNLRDVGADEIGRGDVLLTPDAWWLTDQIDVELAAHQDHLDAVPEQLQAHLGTASTTARVRPLGGGFARLRLAGPLPIRLGDRLVLRDPGRHRIAGGATVVDPDPPELRRRGSGRARAQDLIMLRGGSAADQVRSQVRRRGAIRVADLRLRGFEADTASPVVGDWLVDEDRRDQWADQLRQAARLASDRPLDPGLAADVAVRQLGLPDPALLPVVARAAGLEVLDGRVRDPHADHGLGPAESGVRLLEDHLAARPFLAPEHDQLDDWGLGVRELAAAERLQRVVRLTPEIVLLPTGPALAMRELARLPQPFTASEARTALGTTRRVLIPLLEHLDRRGWTERIDQNRRRIRPIGRGRRVQG